MRLIVDTNTAVSGLLCNSGPRARLIEAAETERIELVSSITLLTELHDVLHRQNSLISLPDLLPPAFTNWLRFKRYCFYTATRSYHSAGKSCFRIAHACFHSCTS